MAKKFSIEAVFKAVDKVSAPISRMGNRIGAFSRSAQKNIENVNRGLKRFAGGALSAGSTLVKAAGAATAGIGAWITMQNRASAETELLAKSVGLQVETLEALSAAVRPAGFNMEHLVDLMEEMNNKLGESAGLEEITPVIESLEILGLEFENIKKLNPAQQFETIANAALKMGDAAQAASALDMLMGGEANKIIGVLRQQGATIGDITKAHQQLTFRTAEGRAGALQFAVTINRVMTVVQSLSAELAGLVGGMVAEWFEGVLVKVRALDKALIAEKIKGYAKQITDFIRYLRDNSGRILEWAERVGKVTVVVLALITALQGVAAVLTIVNALMLANPATWITLGVIALVAALVSLYVYWDKVVAFFKSGIASIAEWWTGLIQGPVTAIVDAAMLVKRVWTGVIDIFDRVADKVRGAARLFASVAAPFGGGSLAMAGPSPSGMSSPQERTARTIEERNTTNRTELTLRNETGKPLTSRGALPPGVKISPSGVF